ncbi:MAG: MFS transporter [Solirubrobacterales bacterium]|nr:MFS transporter [Solirubrobacterales bacterium]
MTRQRWTLLLVCAATFMLLIDVTIVNVALPDIQRELGASLSSLQWVVNAYALTLASFLLVSGSIGDRLGRRRVFSIGFGVFVSASALCGFSSDPTMLNLARGLQGIGAAAMFATALALIAQEFEGRERAKAIGIWGATVGGAVAIGPLIGGILTEGLGWEWIFFVNIPIGVVALVLTETKLVNVRAADPPPIDWAGLVTFSAALFLLIFGLIRGNPEGWGSPLIVACLAGAAVLLGAFVTIEMRRSQAMLDLSLFRKASFGGVSIVAFCLSAGMFSMFLYLTLYIQDVLGYSPLEAGLRFLPLTFLSFVVAPISARLSSRIPFRMLMGMGLFLTGLGLALMHGIEVGDSWTGLLPGFLIAGAGIGMTNPGIASVAIGVVEPARAGMASGINSTFRQVGIATGVAVLGAIFQSRVTSELGDSLPQAPGAFSEAVSSGAAQSALASVPAQFREQATAAASEAFVTGLNEILLFAAAIAFVGGIGSLLLVRNRDMVPFGQPAPEAGSPPALEPVPTA